MRNTHQEVDSDDDAVGVDGDETRSSATQPGTGGKAAPDINVTFTVGRTVIAVGSTGSSLSTASSSQVTAPSSSPLALPPAVAPPHGASLHPPSFLDDLASGMLDKKGGVLRGWKEYFCVLKNGELSYYKKEADAAAGRPPRKFYL